MSKKKELPKEVIEISSDEELKELQQELNDVLQEALDIESAALTQVAVNVYGTQKSMKKKIELIEKAIENHQNWDIPREEDNPSEASSPMINHYEFLENLCTQHPHGISISDTHSMSSEDTMIQKIEQSVEIFTTEKMAEIKKRKCNHAYCILLEEILKLHNKNEISYGDDRFNEVCCFIKLIKDSCSLTKIGKKNYIEIAINPSVQIEQKTYRAIENWGIWEAKTNKTLYTSPTWAALEIN